MQVQEIRKLLLDRAAALGLAADSEEALLDALIEREVDLPSAPTEHDCRQVYELHPGRFRNGDLVEADHILFAVTDAVPLAALRERAVQTLDELRASSDIFGERAASLSNCPSARIGGNLGQITRNDVVPEFWQAIEAFGGTGVMPELVETRFGLHIVRIVRRVSGNLLPFDIVQGHIAQQLSEQRLRQCLRDYAHALVHAAAVAR